MSTPIQATTVATMTENGTTVEKVREAGTQAFEADEPYALPGETLSAFYERVAEEFGEGLAIEARLWGCIITFSTV